MKTEKFTLHKHRLQASSFKLQVKQLFVYCLLLTACYSLLATLVYAKEKVKLIEVTVRHGDTLHEFANKYLKDPSKWPRIHKYNRELVKNPDLIYPLMRIKIPLPLLKDEICDIVHLKKDVRMWKGKEAGWTPAQLNLRLFTGEKLMAGEKSQAFLEFLKSKDILKVLENSLIIIKPTVKREVVELLEGKLDVSKISVLTASCLVEPKIIPKTPEPRFKTEVDKTKTTLVSVYEGIVDVSAKGKTVSVNKGFGTKVKYDRKPEEPKPLPPRLLLPKTAKPAEVDLFRKKEGEKIFYHLQIATVSDFKNMIIDEKRKTLKGAEEDLPDGIYYWRISQVNKDGFEGDFSKVKTLVIDTAAPGIIVTYLKREGKFIKLEGATEAGSVVEVNGKRADIDKTGNFNIKLEIGEEEKFLNIVARDRLGNVGEKRFKRTKEVE